MDPESLRHLMLQHLPGGAPSQLRRAFHSPEPLIVRRARGPYLWTVEDARLLDMNMAFGAIVLGHGDPDVVEAIKSQAETLILHGAGVSEVEVLLASRISSLMPFAEMTVFTPSGTEAVMLAFRLARAYTGRERIVKFEGNYHGWHDYSVYNLSLPASQGRVAETRGIPRGVQETVDVLPYNDTAAFEEYMERHCDEVAAVIMEPVAHSMGVVPADPEFVKRVERLTRSCGGLLIMDEIITAVRHNLHGLQTELGVTADLTTIGKALGNGMPIAALTGRKEILMKLVEDRVISSGTYQSHPLSMAAALTVLEKMEKLGGDTLLARTGEDYCSILRSHVEDLGIDAVVACYRSIFSIYFGLDEEPRSLDDVLRADARRYSRFAEAMRRLGVLVNPNPRKRMHVSLAHRDPVARERFSEAAREALKKTREYQSPMIL